MDHVGDCTNAVNCVESVYSLRAVRHGDGDFVAFANQQSGGKALEVCGFDGDNVRLYALSGLEGCGSLQGNVQPALQIDVV